MLAQYATTKIVTEQRLFFQTNQTKDLSFRLKQLKLLKQAILENEAAIKKGANSRFKQTRT